MSFTKYTVPGALNASQIKKLRIWVQQVLDEKKDDILNGYRHKQRAEKNKLNKEDFLNRIAKLTSDVIIMTSSQEHPPLGFESKEHMKWFLDNIDYFKKTIISLGQGENKEIKRAIDIHIAMASRQRGRPKLPVKNFLAAELIKQLYDYGFTRQVCFDKTSLILQTLSDSQNIKKLPIKTSKYLVQQITLLSSYQETVKGIFYKNR